MKAPPVTVLVPMLVGLLWPVATVAVGLGGATVTSQLNEPLSVEISLAGAELSSSNTHVIGIASASAHAAAGIAYTPLLQQLKVKVVSDHGGNTIFRVTSRDRVREPVVSFLLEFQSSGVRVMRTYAVLLDPPGYRLPKATPSPDPPDYVRPELPTVEPVAETENVMPSARQSYGPVESGDTLSELGFRLRADAGITGAQMAWALYEANPHAFRNGDVNRLLAGTRLSVPSRATALEISKGDARRMLHGAPRPDPVATPRAAKIVEPRALPSSPPSIDVSVETQAMASEASPKGQVANIEPEAEVAEYRLRLVSPDTVGGELSDEGPTFHPEWLQDGALRNLLARLKEEIRRTREDTVRVHLLIARMERTVADLMSTVAGKDAEIATLKSDLARARREKAELSTAPGWFELSILSRRGLEILLALLVLASAGILGVVLSKRTIARQYPESRGGTESEDVMNSKEYSELEIKPSAAVNSTSAEILVEYKSISTDPLLEANAYFDYGHYKKANDLLLEIIDRHPDVPTYRLHLLRVLHAAGETKSFLRHASAFLSLLGDRKDARWLEASRMGREMFPEAKLFQSPFPSEQKSSVV